MRFIVAEISKNWENGQEMAPTGPLCEQFERMIDVNRHRGYRLFQFQIVRMVVNPGILNETLIAVFEKVGEDDYVFSRA